ELKMLRAMQEQLNERTELYAKEYLFTKLGDTWNGDGGLLGKIAGSVDMVRKPMEQVQGPANANDPQVRKTLERIQNEVKELSKSQDEVGKATRDIAEGRNK